MIELENYNPDDNIVEEVSYRDLFETIKSKESFTQREADVLDWIFRCRLRFLIVLRIEEESSRFMDLLERIIHHRGRQDKLSNINGINYIHRWGAYWSILNDSVICIIDEASKVNTQKAMDRFRDKSELRMKK